MNNTERQHNFQCLFVLCCEGVTGPEEGCPSTNEGIRGNRDTNLHEYITSGEREVSE
jgi:hypothetical protein